MRRAALLLFFCLLAGCGSGPEARLEKAREALAKGDYSAAAVAASEGLAAGAQGATAWRLELVALEAEARGGRSADVVARLGRLATGPFATQLTGPLYVQTAGQVKEAGDAAGAVSVLDLGAKRFPQDADIVQAIERAKSTGGAAEVERLRSLGYVE
ncbi:MAG TPA: hypothetical protein VMS55_20690 [Myxococcota bacterium]|nr:hypothetical protein [Myxococcota bacterium]